MKQCIEKITRVFPSPSIDITFNSFRFEKVCDKRSGIDKEANKGKVQALN